VVLTTMFLFYRMMLM